MNDVAASKENHAKLFDNATWIPLLFLRPKRTIHEVVQRTKPVWQLPLLVLSGLILVLALVSAPIKKMAIEMGTNLPPDFQYYSPEMQAQFLEAQASQTSPLFLYVFPVLFGILGIWVTWFITASILHLVITLYGSRASNTKSYNLTAWAMLPIALRLILQIIAVVATKQQISAPGLSGFLTADAQGLTAYLRAILAFVDLYLILQLILMFLGIRLLSGLSGWKGISAVLITMLIVLLLKGLPGLLSSVFSGLSLTGSFFYF